MVIHDTGLRHYNKSIIKERENGQALNNAGKIPALFLFRGSHPYNPGRYAKPINRLKVAIAKGEINMPKIKRRTRYTKKITFTIYVLLNKEDKTFFIAYGLDHAVKNTYRWHHNGRSYKTKQWIENMIREGKRPCLFNLQTKLDTRANTYYRMVVWMKVLKEHGYKAINPGSIREYVKDLREESLPFYEEIKNKDFDSFFICDNWLSIY